MQKELTEMICHAAGELGYSFYTGFAHRIGGELERFPSAWLCPLELTGLQGRYEGRINHRVKLILMRAGAGSDASGKREIRERLEEDAVELYRRLTGLPGLHCSGGITCVPGEFTRTRYGELSLEVSFDTGVDFRAERRWEE